MIRPLAVPAPATDLPPPAHGRKTTGFELFFDLVFVVAVVQPSGARAHHFDWAGAGSSALLLEREVGSVTGGRTLRR